MTFRILTILAFSIWVIGSGTINGQGIVFPWSGAVSRSMGGAGTAAPQDAITASYWNPAAMARFDQSELATSVEMIFPIMSTSSDIGGLFSGTSEADPGLVAMPFVGWVYKPCNPRLTYGFSVVPVGGAKTNYPSSFQNPFFLPQANSLVTPGLFGQIYTEAQFLQIAPSLSYIVNDHFSVGISPTMTVGQVVVDPFFFASPDDTDGSGFPRYPSARGNRFQYGGGVQISAYYQIDPRWSVGTSLKSPQWMETATATGSNELGFARDDLKANWTLPMVLSLGTAFEPDSATTLAFDVRYIDYETAGDAWKNSGFNPDGSLAGLGFGNSYGAMFGIQRRLNEWVAARAGYTFTSSPLSNTEATIGVASPLFYQHAFSTGGSLYLTPHSTIDVAYSYLLESDLQGPIITPLGALPGTQVTTSLSAHAATFGFRVRY